MAAPSVRSGCWYSSTRNNYYYMFWVLVAFGFTYSTVYGQMVTKSPLCGSGMYDIETLTSIPYWTITQPGICYRSWGSQDVCTINLAFCQALPLDKTGGQANMGASQELTGAVGSTPLVLGQTSRIVDDVDGLDLFITFPDGDLVDCGHMGVIVVLYCNEKAGWGIPISGQPAEIPWHPRVTLDRNNSSCSYFIFVQYAGACEQMGLSGGSIVIIIFFCGLAVYLIAGVIYNKSSGASGKELLPHYHTWERLPEDVMLGCGFFFSCITCQSGTKASNDSYENI